MRIRDIIACIEEMAPLSGAADWDRSGLQVYSPRTAASRVCVALDPTPETVKKPSARAQISSSRIILWL